MASSRPRLLDLFCGATRQGRSPSVGSHHGQSGRGMSDRESKTYGAGTAAGSDGRLSARALVCGPDQLPATRRKTRMRLEDRGSVGKVSLGACRDRRFFEPRGAGIRSTSRGSAREIPSRGPHIRRFGNRANNTDGCSRHASPVGIPCRTSDRACAETATPRPTVTGRSPSAVALPRRRCIPTSTGLGAETSLQMQRRKWGTSLGNSCPKYSAFQLVWCRDGR